MQAPEEDEVVKTGSKPRDEVDESTIYRQAVAVAPEDDIDVDA
jgi:hypothetical protein